MASSSDSEILSSVKKYPYPEEVNVRRFVKVILSKQNYFVWRKKMLLFFKRQGLVGFINGEVVAPPEKITIPNDDDVNSPKGTKEIEDQDYEDWKRSDELLQRWIRATISEEVLPHVVCLKTAQDMWSKLITLHETKIEYPHPAEINVRDFVQIKLSKLDNYFRWKSLMLGLIENQGMFGFISGEVSAPPETIRVPVDDDDDSFYFRTKEIENQDYQDWKRSDELLQRWIKQTINEDVLPSVECWKTAKDIWSQLVILGERKMEYPIDINVTDIVPIKLSSSTDNYSSWKTLMLHFIESQGMLGFINGEASKQTLSDDNSSSNDEWRKSDEKLQRWIKETINVDIRRDLVLLETSKDIWERLIIMHETNMVYPYPIEVNACDFVPFKLSYGNYREWRCLMVRLIANQGLIGFIFPQHHHIPRIDSLAWKRTDALLQSWIIRTINESFLPSVLDLQSASDMWTKLDKLSNSKTLIEYPYPVEVNVGDYVPVKLSRENYSLWAKLMRRLIKTQGLKGFITGTVPRPDETWKNDNRREAWKRTDGLLQSWIMGTMDQKDLVACVVNSETAHDMWNKLQKVFTQKSSYKRSETMKNKAAQDKDLGFYRPLHRATLRSEWDKAKEFLEQEQDAVHADITGQGETILMVAIRSQKRNHFVKNLLDFMSSDEDLTVTNHKCQTSLHLAVSSDNLEAAKLLVAKDQSLPNVKDDYGNLPLQLAAYLGHRNMVLYLMDVTGDVINHRPFEDDEDGGDVVIGLILHGLYDIALLLVKRYGAFAREELQLSLLQAISMENSAFRSGKKFNFGQSLIYFYVPAKLEEPTWHWSGGDIENPINCCIYDTMKQKLLCLFWKVAEMLVPWIKRVREIKWKNEHALQLVKQLCMEYEKFDFSEVGDIIRASLIAATTLGIPEVVKEIISVFPETIYTTNEEEQNLFYIAILNRQRNVFKLIYQLSDKSIIHSLLTWPDSSLNTSLDLVACLKSEQSSKLKIDAAGAALQMQLELQWFKEVEKISIFYGSKWEIGRKTPAMIFSETHRDLMKEGEKWLKDTANSCTIVAALVVTIVFAAVITVPGGSDNINGLPIFSKDKAFIIFIISDALALFSSASSLLMFLSILTSRYAEIDFLSTLPKRLIFGLITLFVSIVSMMIAFGATLYLIFGQKKSWILTPISVFSTAPVILFASWQFPLLWDMIKSTYGDGIFGKHSDALLF
ncbi:uncharacterized protein LOC132311840 isoform X1 [Cornus florida]|uniref:uncharacterized protein LOC132311840 isoform X1 n=1 Tax=Cornus florida TaxID=4283 RepID=UPI00289E2143|nr:uncharacterized protein LOC132311840 isoform X1 [Cornus florida]